jgi:uncharacterized membrane protein
MNFTLSKLASTGIFFVFIFLSGFWLNRRGSPYSMLLVTVHKLIGLAAGIFLGLNIYRINEIAPLSLAQIVAVVVTILLFAVNVATGSLLSTNKPMPKTVSIINKFSPYLTVVSSGVMLYLLS